MDIRKLANQAKIMGECAAEDLMARYPQEDAVFVELCKGHPTDVQGQLEIEWLSGYDSSAYSEYGVES